MIDKQNLHVHTNYCDGKDSPREMLETAIEKGFTSIGFSGHSYMHYSPSHSMSLEGTEEYKREITALKSEYADRIKVFLGLEMDMLSEIDLSGYEYMIGSVHYFKIGNEYVGFDRGQDEVKRVIDTWFGGNGMAYAKMYYEYMAELPKYGKYDIIGHFDLITKHSENVMFFDEESKEYKGYVTTALEALAGKIPFFEVNTGAISRGYRTTPYPTAYILGEMKRLGFGAVISSDCHNRNDLDCYYQGAEELLLSCGFKEQYILTDKGFVASPLGK